MKSPVVSTLSHDALSDERTTLNACVLSVALTSEAVSLLDEIKCKAADRDHSATIERLIRSGAHRDADANGDEASGDADVRNNLQPLASAIFYHQIDGCWKPVLITVTSVEGVFCLTLHDANAECADRSFSFADFPELARALDDVDDPRFSFREARLFLELFGVGERPHQRSALAVSARDL